MSGNINSNLTAMLKVLYPSGGPEDSIIKRHPFLAMLKKNTDFGGHYMHVPVTVNRGSNASRTASTAFGYTNVSNNVAFAVTRGHDYATAYIPREDWLASKKGGSQSFVNVAKREVDGELKELTRRLARDLYRDGSGTIGQVGSISTTALTLKVPADARFFEIGQKIAASDDLATLLDSGAVATVTAVDRSTGVITASASWTTAISGLDADDYLFVDGDFNVAAGTDGVKGLSAWLTTSTPGALFGVTRTVDKARLSGVATSFASSAMREGLMDTCTQLDIQTGGQPDIVLINPVQWNKLAKELESERQYPVTEKYGAKGQFGFDTLKLHTPSGVVNVVGDGDCPTDRGFVLDSSTWELASLGKAPHIQMEDGSAFDRNGTADAYGVRVSHYSQLVCYAPGQNAIITIS